ncbi:hypothetical protein WDU94_012524 [Cyamophila willieti]
MILSKIFGLHFILLLIYCFQTLLGSPVDNHNSKSASKQVAARLNIVSQSPNKKHKSMISKSVELQGSLKKNDLAGLTKDQFIDLLSAAAADSVDRSPQSHDDGMDPDHVSLDSEDPAESTELGKTCGIAMRAAEEAKAASQAQNSAGLQAAREVKLQLAEKAQRAANAAQAALSEKQNEMHMLEDQMHDAETVMLEEHDSLNQTRKNVDTAAKTVEHAKEQYRALEAALKLSKQTIASAEELAQGAQHELNEKIKLMTAAKSKVSELERELEKAKKEFVNTRESAMRAAEAAKEAQMNANQNTK